MNAPTGLRIARVIAFGHTAFVIRQERWQVAGRYFHGHPHVLVSLAPFLRHDVIAAVKRHISYLATFLSGTDYYPLVHPHIYFCLYSNTSDNRTFTMPVISVPHPSCNDNASAVFFLALSILLASTSKWTVSSFSSPLSVI